MRYMGHSAVYCSTRAIERTFSLQSDGGENAGAPPSLRTILDYLGVVNRALSFSGSTGLTK
jgi:hypothetical protein